MSKLVSELDAYLRRLFPINRSITGNGNRDTLRILREIVPLTIHEVPTGTRVFDWTIPDEWNIRDGWIATPDGRRIVDFSACNLHVASYSEPVRGTFRWGELQPHLHVHPELPEAVPYRTFYYRRTWGFCLTRVQYRELEHLGGPFEVAIESELKPGSLTYGELLIPGESAREILLSCYICHPSMANDSLSGVLLTTFLARDLLRRGRLHNSYRIAFVPETIGAIAYCALNEQAMRRIDTGLVITTVGGPGRFGYKQSFNSGHAINRLIEEVFEERGVRDYVTYPFDVHGSDERQYSSIGFRINTATITRDKYYEYPYYHTSLDNLDFVSAGQIAETFELYRGLIDKLERERRYINLHPNCEVMLSKHDLYPKTGGGQVPKPNDVGRLDCVLWLLFHCDGTKSLADIAKSTGIPVDSMREAATILESKGILKAV